MYGFPLSIYLLSGWLGNKFPQINFLTHDNGHLLYTLLGFQGDPHTNIIHILSNVLILLGYFLLSSSWRVLFKAQKANELATTGPYHYIRHPQYVAFILIMLGFLFQWPTILTLIMFPILVLAYTRLSIKEEKDIEREFGNAYRDYAGRTPRYFPHLSTIFEKKSQHGQT